MDVEVEYVLPDAERDTPHSRYLDNDDYELTGAELHHKDGEWFVHLRTKAEVESDTLEQAPTEHSTVLGGDLNVDQFAVTSTGVFWRRRVRPLASGIREAARFAPAVWKPPRS